MATIKGLDKLLKQFDSIKEIDISQGLLGAGYILQKKSQELCPVDTGFLRNSASTEIINPKLVEMSFSAGYASYVEFGTAKWSGKPYVRPAIESERDSMVTYLKNYVQEEIKKEAK